MSPHHLIARGLALGVLWACVVLASLLLFETGTVELAWISAVTWVSALFSARWNRSLVGAIERRLAPRKPRSDSLLAASRAELVDMRKRSERVERLAIAGELAAQIAHEIKNPLAPIRGYAQFLSNKLEAVDPSERASFEKGLNVIRTETDRINERINQLLSLARREVDATQRSCHLNGVVKDAVAVAEGEPGVSQIISRLDPAIERVIGDADDLRGALLNLMKNAVEARVVGDGARVEVVTRLEGERAIIEVLDEGQGLDPIAAEKAFDAFYTTKAEGTGLGLAIARAAVDAAGGAITLVSRPNGKGAIARVELDLSR